MSLRLSLMTKPNLGGKAEPYGRMMAGDEWLREGRKEGRTK